MEELIQLGKIAGIAGISLGLIFLLLKQIIAKNIFPNLTQEQAYKIIRLIIILLFIIGVVGMLLWTYSPSRNGSGTRNEKEKGDTTQTPIKEKILSDNKKTNSIRIHIVDSRSREYFLDTIENILKPVIKSAYTLQTLPVSHTSPADTPDIVVVHLHAFGQNDNGLKSQLANRLADYYSKKKNTQFIVYSRSFQWDNGIGWKNDNSTDITLLKSKISTIYLPNANEITTLQKENLRDSLRRKIQLVDPS